MNFPQVSFTPLKIIPMDEGSVMHGLKRGEESFVDFGEAYFSKVKTNVIKGWKVHYEMTLNLVVPVGSIRFVIFDERGPESNHGFREWTIGEENYGRLTVPPGVWMAFQGVGEGLNLLLNVADLEHRPEEISRKELEEIPYSW